MKRLISIILSLCMICSCFLTYAEEAEEPAITGYGTEKLLADFEPEFLLDFEDYNYSIYSESGFDRIRGSQSFPKDYDGYGSTFSVATTGSCYVFKALENPINDGLYLMSFDIKKSAKEGITYIRPTLSENNSFSITSNIYETFVMNSSVIGQYSNGHGWTIIGNKSYEADKWYHINMWLDFTNGKNTLYANNEFICSTGMTKSAYGFWFMNESGKGTTITSFDNYGLYKSSPALIKTLCDNGIAVPDEYRSPVNMSITTKYSGNLFTEFNDVSINVDYSNTNTVDITCKAEYTAENYCGDVVWSKKEDISFKVGESVTKVLTPKVDKYDIYTLKVKLTPEDPSLTEIERSVQFSVVSAAKDGFTSDYFGTATHIAKGVTKWDKLDRIMDLSGMGWIRDECTWNSYETADGVYGMNPTVEQYIRDCKEMGIKVILLWGPYNNVHGVTYNNVPKETEQLEAMQRAAEHFAKNYCDIVDAVEFGNEQNFARQDALSCADYAKALQYFYNGIKKYAPDMKILAADTSRADGEWIERMLLEGGKGYCDVITIHPYQEAGSPESKLFTEHIYKEVRSRLEAIGCGDMEIWATESNSSSSFQYNTEQQHGFNFTRQIMQCIANNAMEKILIYQIQTPDADIKNNEDCFGILRGTGVANAYGPKSAYMQMTAMANQLSGATYKDQLCKDNIYTFRFDKVDGSHMLMMYADRDVVPVALNLGSSSGTLYDMNGNPTDYTTDNGIFSFVLTDAPVYFVYKGEGYDFAEEKYFASDALLRIPEGCTKTATMIIPADAQIAVNTRKDYLDVELVRNGDNTSVRVTVKSIPELTEYSERRQDFGTQIYRDYVNLTVKYGNTKEMLPIAVEYLKLPANMTAALVPYDNTSYNYWKLKVNIQNITEDKSLKGTLRLTSLEGVKEVAVKELKPGKTASYYLSIPSKYTKESNHYQGVFITDEGVEIPFRVGDVTESYGYKSGSRISPKYLKKATAPITIDGVLNENEWKDYLITNFDKSQVSYGSTGTVIAGVVEGETFGEDADYGGKSDFSGAIYSQWDDKYLYLAAQVNDDVHYAKEPTIRTYLDDFFYIDVCPLLTQRHDTRLEMSLSSFFDDNKGRLFRNWSEVLDKPIGGVIDESEDGARVEVIRKENTTIYECRIPWTEVLSEQTYELKNFSLNFGIRDYDGDRDKTFTSWGWYCLVDSID